MYDRSVVPNQRSHDVNLFTSWGAEPSARSASHHNLYTRWHGSVGRAHRSHRWGRWFESNCHHHSQALVDQGLASFLPYSHVRDLSLLTACSTNEAMRRWHGFVAWRYGFFARKSHGSVAVLEGERSDSFLILHWNQRIINCIKSANMIQPYARRP